MRSALGSALKVSAEKDGKIRAQAVALRDRDDEAAAQRRRTERLVAHNGLLERSRAALVEELDSAKRTVDRLSELHTAASARVRELMDELARLRAENAAQAEAIAAGAAAETGALSAPALMDRVQSLLEQNVTMHERIGELERWIRQQMLKTWKSDGGIVNCVGCSRTFTWLLRRHHCRLCGDVFCRNCTTNRLQTTASRHPARVCDVCYDAVNAVACEVAAEEVGEEDVDQSSAVDPAAPAEADTDSEEASVVDPADGFQLLPIGVLSESDSGSELDSSPSPRRTSKPKVQQASPLTSVGAGEHSV